MRLEANKTLEVVKRQGIVIAMVAVFIVFGILSKIVNGVNSFATWGALMQILQQNAWLGIMACGMTFAIIGGNFDLIVDLAKQGMAVIVISSEMPEIMGISNRIIAVAQGIQTGELKEGDITEEKLIRAITIADSSMSA